MEKPSRKDSKGLGMESRGAFLGGASCQCLEPQEFKNGGTAGKTSVGAGQ